MLVLRHPFDAPVWHSSVLKSNGDGLDRSRNIAVQFTGASQRCADTADELLDMGGAGAYRLRTLVGVQGPSLFSVRYP